MGVERLGNKFLYVYVFICLLFIYPIGIESFGWNLYALDEIISKRPNT